jgi:hypothetical protein
LGETSSIALSSYFPKSGATLGALRRSEARHGLIARLTISPALRCYLLASACAAVAIRRSASERATQGVIRTETI